VTRVSAPRSALGECNNEREREFVELLHAYAEAGGWFADSWPRDDRIVLSVCPSDPEQRCVLRTLRVDFDGVAVSYGPDETHQFVTDLDPTRPDVTVMSGRPVAELALAAATWLQREMWRPILRHEWDRPDFRRMAWVLADTGEELAVSDSSNDLRRQRLGPPDCVVQVWGNCDEPQNT
jgi:hypothetical protein